MATYPTLHYGAVSEEVRKLQEKLNSAGNYALTVDGIYGEKTKAAVTDYQKKNGLSPDGIAGEITLGHLYGQPAGEQAAEKAPTAWEKWVEREPFSYDPEKDILYRQYADQYTRLGRLAMEDTVGKAAALTGGYGNSYAESAGQRAYQGYLQQLGDVLPQMYDRAYARYQAEGEALYQEALAYEEQRQQAYARLESLVAGGYTPTDGELSSAGMTRAQAQSIRSAAQKTTVRASTSASTQKSASPGGYSYQLPDYTEADIKALQAVAGLTQDGIWGLETEKAYLDGYRKDGSVRIQAFLETLIPESSHDQIQRHMWGSYRNYVLAAILNDKKLRDPEKAYLKAMYGFTEAEVQHLKKQGLVKK